MPSWLTLALGAVNNFLKWMGIREKRAERADDQKTGSIKQREVDQRQTIKDQDDQAKEAADARPGDFGRWVRRRKP